MDLVELLKAKVAEIDGILSRAQSEGRGLTEDEQKKLDALEKERDEIRAKIEAREATRKRAAANKATSDWLSSPVGRITDPPQLTRHDDTPAAPSFVRRHRIGKLRSFQNEDEAYAAGQFFLASIWGRKDAARWCETNIGDQLAIGGEQDSKGGFLVPTFLSNAIIDLRETYGVFRRNCRVIPMPNDTYIIPRRASGVTAYFVGANSEITASDKSWDAVELTARKVAALCKYSREIADDAIISIADDLANEIAYAFAVKEDACGFLGTGTQTYGGIVGLLTKCTAATAGTYTALAGNTAFSTLDLADFEAMIGQLPNYALPRAKWYISQAGWAASMMRLADAAGGATIGEITGGAGKQFSFLGFPVEIVQTMNSTLTAQTSTKGLCYFGDLASAATLGERRGITIDASAERYFEYDQLAIRGVQRFDIVVHDVGDTSVAGPLIMLATPAS